MAAVTAVWGRAVTLNSPEGNLGEGLPGAPDFWKMRRSGLWSRGGKQLIRGALCWGSLEGLPW